MPEKHQSDLGLHGGLIMAGKILEISGIAKTSLIFGDFDIYPNEQFKARLSETQFRKLEPYIEIENIKELNTSTEKVVKSSKKK